MITRRNFINGLAVGAAGAAAGWGLRSRFPAKIPPRPYRPAGFASARDLASEAYPPNWQGMRGQNDAAFRVAHQMAFEGRTDWGNAAQTDPDYDLIVVGAGLSGLAAAHFYQKRHPDARILILENCDDFGGHARRNEFSVDGRTFLGTGGSQSIVNIDINAPMAELLSDLAVDLSQFENGAYDEDFFDLFELTQHWYFDRETYGRDALVPLSGPLGFHIPFPDTPFADSIARMPLSQQARDQLLALFQLNENRTPPSIFSEMGFLQSTSYERLLKDYCGVTDQQLLDVLGAGVNHSGFSIDNATAEFAISAGLPGIGGTSLRHFGNNRFDKMARWFINYVHHFPDGNASMARLMVRHLIPQVSDGGTSMQSIVTAPFDYSRLDEDDAPVRLRLSSTVVQVAHDGNPAQAQRVKLSYIRNDQVEQVGARHCILACQNRMIPYIWQEIPAPQADALRLNVRAPVFYSNVVLRQWEPLRQAKLGGAFCPGCLHTTLVADLPVSLGDYQYTNAPDDPIVLYLGGSTRASGEPDLRERFKMQRAELLGMPFSDFEEDIRRQLTGMLGPYGFDPDADIAGITVNRWGHGFTMPADKLFDPDYPEGAAPHEVGRTPLGRVAIANCDAGAMGMQQASYEQAWRAVEELG